MFMSVFNHFVCKVLHMLSVGNAEIMFVGPISNTKNTCDQITANQNYNGKTSNPSNVISSVKN